MADNLQQKPISTGASPLDLNVQSDQNFYNDLVGHYRNDGGMPWAWNPNDQNVQGFTSQVNQDMQKFASQFENYVGRAPTQDEVQKFRDQFILPNVAGIRYDAGTGFNSNIATHINEFLGNNFQQAANDTATQKLQGQRAQANSLADLFRNQGNQAISSTESSLLDYQSKLFDRLRPNLITSLKAQGLLDTGGMNEALAGQQGDLANAGSNYIAQLKLQNDQAANNIAFSGASAPYQFQQSQIMNQPGTMMTQGQNAMNQNYDTLTNSLNYGHQLGLIGAQARAQENMRPSFLRTMGQSFANNMGQQGAQAVGQLFKPSSYMTGFGG